MSCGITFPSAEKKWPAIARLLGEDVSGLNLEDAAERGIIAVEKLRKAIGIPERIRDLGGTREQLPGFAQKAYEIKRLMLLNPRFPANRICSQSSNRRFRFELVPSPLGRGIG